MPRPLGKTKLTDTQEVIGVFKVRVKLIERHASPSELVCQHCSGDRGGCQIVPESAGVRMDLRRRRKVKFAQGLAVPRLQPREGVGWIQLAVKNDMKFVRGIVASVIKSDRAVGAGGVNLWNVPDAVGL